jgi:hypothetical protein
MGISCVGYSGRVTQTMPLDPTFDLIYNLWEEDSLSHLQILGTYIRLDRETSWMAMFDFSRLSHG